MLTGSFLSHIGLALTDFAKQKKFFFLAAVLIPEARVAIAPGQMRERELEQVMADFYHHRFNVLVCTTIIETCIDVPTANTIIMNRADKLGLAQLHQLRGRVGRSHHQAYAYLLTPDKKSMTADAIKRLDAIASLEDLGAGFTLATHDLEIRGAGELLGENQSGNMHAIGFSLYMEMLEQAVKALRSGKEPDLAKPFESGPEIDLGITALNPNDYLPDVQAVERIAVAGLGHPTAFGRAVVVGIRWNGLVERSRLRWTGPRDVWALVRRAIHRDQPSDRGRDEQLGR